MAMAEVTGVDPERRQVLPAVDRGETAIAYVYLVLATGVEGATSGTMTSPPSRPA